MTIESAFLLHDLISDQYHDSDYLGSLKIGITLKLFDSKIEQLKDEEIAIRTPHQLPSLFGEPDMSSVAVTYNKRIYFSYSGFEPVVPLKPAYAERMDAWIISCNELIGLIHITAEYMHDLFATAVCKTNFQKLMPTFIYSEFLRQLGNEKAVPQKSFLRTEPELTDKTIAAFQDKYAGLVNQLKIIHLNNLTGASCPSEQKILLI